VVGATRPEWEVGRGEDRSDGIRGEAAVELASMCKGRNWTGRILCQLVTCMPAFRFSGAIRSERAAADVGKAGSAAFRRIDWVGLP
jgi:hypothetical protein